MKICTITCHDVYNHGASLQAYALMAYLKKYGHTVEIIDYKPDYLNNHYKLLNVDNPKWEKNIFIKLSYLAVKLPMRIKGLQRKKAFDNFTSKYLKLTKKRYSSNQQLKKRPPEADAYICGSDQIWNALHKNGRDPAFYLDFVPENKIKLSYAASFATESILDEYKPLVKEKVNRLDHVSVREKSGVNILKNLGIKNAVNVVDPAFLLGEDEWNRFAEKNYKEKYILIYDFDNSELIKKLALEIAREQDLAIYSINPTKIKYADRSLKYVGPESFIALIRDASFVVSNSFHAAVFSVIYKKNFAIVNRTENINSRMQDLIDDLNLNEKLIYDSYSIDDILKPIDYIATDKILKEKINFSKEFLNNALVSNMKMVSTS